MSTFVHAPTQVVIKPWLVPVSTLLFSIVFYITHVGRINDHLTVLQYGGLLLVSLANIPAVAAWWLMGARGARVAVRFPEAVRLLHDKPVTLLTFSTGLLLFGVAWLMIIATNPMPNNHPQPSVQTSRPADAPIQAAPSSPPGLTASAPAAVPALTRDASAVPARSAMAPVPLPAPAAPEPQRPITKDAPQPIQQRATAPTRPVTVTAPVKEIRAVSKPLVSNARCTRLLEKAGSGEPLSSQEQHELVSLCQ